jgi:hypothetical protein
MKIAHLILLHQQPGHLMDRSSGIYEEIDKALLNRPRK